MQIIRDITRLLACMVTALCVAAAPLSAQGAPPRSKRAATTQQAKGQRTADSVKKEKTSTQKKISETTNKLNSTGAELKRQLNALNSINADVRQQQEVVSGLRTRIDSLAGAIETTSDSIKILEAQLEMLRLAYGQAMRQLQPSASQMDAMAFVFSARSFSEAYSRLRYLQRFSEWRKERAEDIDKAIDRIGQRRQHLAGLRHEQDQAYREAQQAHRTLAQKQEESEKMVRNLKQQDTQLRAELARQKKQAAALDNELDRIIAEQERQAREKREREQQKAAAKGGGKSPQGKTQETVQGQSAAQVASAKAETRTAAAIDSELTGSFASNKGRLPFPVGGSYKIVRPFGRHPHPTQRNVVTDNSGIDIEVSAGASCRAVFDGEVSAIFQQDGFHTIIMVRHGAYLTVYAGLAGAAVKVGQKVKTGQTLGQVYSDSADGGRSILHFEVRNERTKLNPTTWVR